jgi:hypothetical protein
MAKESSRTRKVERAKGRTAALSPRETKGASREEPRDERVRLRRREPVRQLVVAVVLIVAVNARGFSSFSPR